MTGAAMRVRALLPRLSLLAVLAAVCIAFSLLTPAFLAWSNFTNIMLQAAATAIAAVGMTFVILTRGIDLSVGSTMNLALVLAVLLGGVRVEDQIAHDTTAWVYPIALGLGLLLGCCNAIIIRYLRVNPLVATLGTLTLYRGLALHFTGATEIIVFGDVFDFGRGIAFLGIGWPVIAAIVLTVLAGLVLRHTPTGLHVLAIGGSPRSAEETGLPVARCLLIVYGLAGLCAAAAGLILVGRIGGLNPDLGWGFEFTVITAVVLGGTSLFGGRGSIVGSVLGAVLLTAINNGLNLIAANPFIYDVVRGFILITGVTLDAMASRLRNRRTGVAEALSG